MNIFIEEFEEQAIDRIQRFSALAASMGYEPVLGFSGGKDSQVCYDLCKRAGIKFKAKFNHCFESAEALKFIRDYYPEVEWRRVVKQGFIRNIDVNHKGFLPTVESSYCCFDYKHNSKYVDAASIVGIRKAESRARAKRNVLHTHTATQLRKQHDILTKYFTESCIASGAPSEITLYHIVDWSEEDVWEYIRRHNLPVNPAYKNSTRVGCIVCPKANFNSNYKALLEHPKLIDCFIKARQGHPNVDWYITCEGKDYIDDKPRYICKWLNHSFRPLTKRQERLVEQVLERYNRVINPIKNKKNGKEQ